MRRSTARCLPSRGLVLGADGAFSPEASTGDILAVIAGVLSQHLS